MGWVCVGWMYVGDGRYNGFGMWGMVGIMGLVCVGWGV